MLTVLFSVTFIDCKGNIKCSNGGLRWWKLSLGEREAYSREPGQASPTLDKSDGTYTSIACLTYQLVYFVACE